MVDFFFLVFTIQISNLPIVVYADATSKMDSIKYLYDIKTQKYICIGPLQTMSMIKKKPAVFDSFWSEHSYFELRFHRLEEFCE